MAARPAPPPRPGAARDLLIEADERRSFAGPKAAVPWVWVALDAECRRVGGMVVGDRSAFTAEGLRDPLPAEHRERAVFCTDFLASYRAAVPEGRRAAAGKHAGLTCHVERFWLTLRQRRDRLVRKTLSVSKYPLSHIGALWYFVRLYNESRE